MSDEAPKSPDTVRPPEGDEDVYSASTKTGQAAPEILALVAKAEAAALKPARLPSGVDLGMHVDNAPAAPKVPVAEPPKPAVEAGDALHEEAAAGAAAQAAHDTAQLVDADRGADEAEEAVDEVAASTDNAAGLRSEQGIPPLSLLVLAVAVGIAAWLGYQAMTTPAPAPANTPPPGLAH
jgi:hypothetical protein